MNIKKSSIQKTITKLKQLEQTHKEQQKQQQRGKRARTSSADSFSKEKLSKFPETGSAKQKRKSIENSKHSLAGLVISSPKQHIKFGTFSNQTFQQKLNDLNDLQELKKMLLNKKMIASKPTTGNAANTTSVSGSKKFILPENVLNSPQKRQVTLYRDEHLGFGFIAGSEKPLVIRFVTPGLFIWLTSFSFISKSCIIGIN